MATTGLPGTTPASSSSSASHAVDAYTAAQAAQDAAANKSTRVFRVWRGEANKGEFVEFEQQVVKTFFLSNADLKETIDLLRVVLGARRIAPVAGSDQRAEVERLISLGAARTDIGQREVPWVVMVDPDGNELLFPLDETNDRERVRDSARTA